MAVLHNSERKVAGDVFERKRQNINSLDRGKKYEDEASGEREGKACELLQRKCACVRKVCVSSNS